MNKTLPSNNKKFLKELLGKEIISVKRQIFKDDMCRDDYEQSADGPIEIELNNGIMVHFIADTNDYSVGVVKGEMPRYGESYMLVNLSENFFWKKRLHQEITQITILKLRTASEDFPCEFGLSIELSNGENILVQFLDEEDYPDMINVSEGYPDMVDVCQTTIS